MACGRLSTWRTAPARSFGTPTPNSAALVSAGYFPVVIGQAGHVEVRGLTEDFPGAIVIGETADIAQLPEKARYGVVSQTTQPIERVRTLVAEIRRAHPRAEVRFADTVCKPTKDRQTRAATPDRAGRP